MNREVNLSQYVPYDIIGKTPEMRGLQYTEELEFDEAWGLANYVQDASFIFTTDPASIVYWEKILSLPHTGTLEERRRKVFIEWNKNVIWTHRTLEKWLNEAVGHDKYDLKIFYNDYALKISVSIKDSVVDHKWLASRLREIIPANLSMLIEYLLITLLKIQTQHGVYNYPLIYCGEETCGDVPFRQYEVEPIIVDLKAKTGNYTAPNKVHYIGEGYGAGQINDDGSIEEVYMQDFSSEDIYNFSGLDEGGSNA